MTIEDEFVRDTRAMERIATSFERLADVFEKRFAKDFPEPKVKREAEIIRADERSDQYSDKLTPGWLDETPKDAEPSRFAKRFEKDVDAKTPAPGAGTNAVPKGNKNNAKSS